MQTPDPRAELVLQNEAGLLFWPAHEIASIVPEFRDRLRVVHADGSVAHRPGPAPAGPWLDLGPARVTPGLLRQHEGQWYDPAGFALGTGELESLPELPPEEPLPGLPFPPGAVLYLRGAGGQAWWHTDAGLVPAGVSAEAARPLHPHLVPAGRGCFVNRRRLRAILPERKRFRLRLDNGEELLVSWGAREALSRGLGLAQLYTLSEAHDALYREGLRDWPYELARAPHAMLARFGLRGLIANQIWQALRYRQQGLKPDYGTEHRGFWYVPLKATLIRAGLLRGGEDERVYDPVWWLYLDVLADLIGRDRLFTFRELGFHDPQPDLRKIGNSTVVVAEKSSLGPFVDKLAELGVSTLILGGLPALISTEFFADAIREVTQSVRVVAYVDFDPGGWIAGDSFCQQLERYGITCLSLTYLVRPELFTAEEIELFSFLLHAPTPQVAGKIKAWVARSGGIQGEARGIHADYLRPEERVVAAFVELTSRP